MDAIPVETARRKTELFARHCHHAAPFSRAERERLGQRCEADPAQHAVPPR